MIVLALALATALAPQTADQASGQPDTVVVNSGALTLRALLWRPHGIGPFPAVMFNHGSFSTDDPLALAEAMALGPVFASHGYVFLFLCRRGIGLSLDQGPADGDLMARALATGGQVGRNRVQLQLLESEELNEALAGLAFLRALREVDVGRVAVVGHSFGGSLTLLWPPATSHSEQRWCLARPPPTGDNRLTFVRGCCRRLSAPVLFIHAVNDDSIAPGESLAAEMQRLKKVHQLHIYPAVGRSPQGRPQSCLSKRDHLGARRVHLPRRHSKGQR